MSSLDDLSPFMGSLGVGFRGVGEFTGKDRAAGKHWEDWVKAYNDKKAAGEKNIALVPETLD